MYQPISLFIGLRYLRKQRNNRFVSFISLISILGLSIGVAVLITVVSVFNGFERELRTRILGMLPHVSIASNTILTQWPELVAQSKKSPHVVAAAPFTQLQTMLTANGQVSGTAVFGIDPKLEQQVSILPKHMLAGQLGDLSKGRFNIVLGVELAKNLGVGVGDKITLVMPEATTSAVGIIPRFKRFTVSGLFKVSADMDGQIAYIHLYDASTLLRLPDGAQGVRLTLDDIFKADKVVQSLQTTLPRDVYIYDWSQTNGQLFSAIQMEKAMVAVLLCLIVLVAAFNQVSSLVMVVTEKKADIAILRTMGASPQLITRIFMVQGTAIGVIGTIIGAVLGLIMAASISQVVGYINDLFGFDLFAAYLVHYLPSEIRALDVVVIVLGALIISFLATVYPARKAARIQPAEALRYE